MDNDPVVARLDTLIAILQLVYKDELDRARREILADQVASAVMEVASAPEGVEAGQLRTRVAIETRQSERTVARRVANLVSQRALEQVGSGSKVRYRATGLL
jgi:hypothetical protein